MADVRKFIGLRAGDRCNGLDAVLIEVQDSGLNIKVRYLESCRSLHTPRLRNELLHVIAPAKTRTEELAKLNLAVGYAFAACAKELMLKARVQPKEIAAIGSGGLPVCRFEESEGEVTTQSLLWIGEPSVIAAQTGIPVVDNFEMSDLAAGGRGGPLSAWAHHVLFNTQQTRCVLGIGRMAHLTVLPAGNNLDRVIAMDTGPGCVVIDELIRRASSRKHDYDPGGRYAARGVPDDSCVEQVLQLPYFLDPPPKFSGPERFGKSFVNGFLKMMESRPQTLGKYDKIATATLVTARSIARSLDNDLVRSQPIGDVVACGGGTYNTTLMNRLQVELGDTRLTTTEQFRIPVDAMKGIEVAILAAAHVDRVSIHLPHLTGATTRSLLGRMSRC